METACQSEPMSRDFPDIVDPWKVAEGRRAFGGTMPLSRLDRLSELLAPSGEAGSPGADEGLEAAFSATFGFDRQGLVVIDVEVNAELPLVCQRSLDVFRFAVNRRSKLVVIETVAEQETTPDNYEPILVENRRLALADLVEEELLLAVPQVPKRPDASGESESSPEDAAVAAASEEESEPTHRPFSGLAGLMKKPPGT